MIFRCALCGTVGTFEDDPAVGAATDTGEPIARTEMVNRYLFPDGAEAGVCSDHYDDHDQIVSAFRLVQHELTEVPL